MSFFVADENILKSKLLKPADKLVYYALVSFYNRKTKVCYPRVQTIANRIGFDKRTVYRSIARLKKLGFINTTRKQSTLEYRLPLHEKLLSTDTYSRYDKKHNSDMTQVSSINKTKYIKPYSNYSYRNSYSQNSTFLPSQNKDIEFNNIKLRFYASEGIFDQFRDSDGNEYVKNRLNGEVKKNSKKIAYDRTA